MFDGSAFPLRVKSLPLKGESEVANSLGLSIAAY